REAILLGVYSFTERREWVVDTDKNGRFVMVNKNGWIALKLRDIDFVDNDRTVYAFVKDGKIFTIKGVLLVDRLLNPDEYLYLLPDGSLKTSYERPHPRQKQAKTIKDTLSVKIKRGLNWINAGIAKTTSSMDYGQVIKAEIISHLGQKGWSLKTIDVTVLGEPSKWYIITPTKTYPVIISPGEWKEVRLSVSKVQIYDPQGFTIDRLLVSCVLNKNAEPIDLGILAVGCPALTLGISVRAKLKYDPNVHKEILFSTY
ncbi:MAG TPA: hypothetical protein VLS94_00920, partial [Fusibacter sp.]|nr:hypothetical protein [Fusibacter sp.]